MLVPDVNVVLAGFRTDHVHHRVARQFLDEARSGDEPIGLPMLVLGSVVRLATNPRVFVQPDHPRDVLEYLDTLLDPPGQPVVEQPSYWPRFRQLCETLELTGNHVPDGHVAAIAIDNGAELVTFDRGFRRFRRLRWRNLLD